MKMLKIKTKEIVWILIIVMVMMLFFSGPSIGKGFQETIIQAQADVAEPILDIDGGGPIYITKANQKIVYEFKVKNFNSMEKLNEVNIEYYLEILGLTDKRVSIKVFKENEELKLYENKTPNLKLKNSEKQEDNFKIEIEFDENTNIEEMQQNIEIKIYANQLLTNY